MEDSRSLQQLAAKCRRLADAVSDGPARASLLKLADEYQQRSQKDLRR